MFKQEKKAVEEQLTTNSNTIGKGTGLVGDIETFGNIRIDGKVKGNITTKSKLVLGNSSFVDGNVLAKNAEIEGEVSGCVEVTELLVLKATANVRGDILTKKLVVEPGAIINATCQVGEEAVKKIIIDLNEINDLNVAAETEGEAETEAAKSA